MQKALLGYNPSRNYERGDVDIPTAILIRLADFYGVSIDYLLGRTDNPQMNR